MSEEEEDGADEGIDLLADSDILATTTKREREEVDIQNIVRPGFEATENSSYYNLAALYILLYAHIKEGVPVPALFSKDNHAPKFDY
jgi:hypothetical protein